MPAAISYGSKLGFLNNAAIGQTYYDQFRPFLRGMDALVQGSVLSTTTSTPPSSPNDGDAYLLIGTLTGAWAGKANQVAVWAAQATAMGTNNLVPAWDYYTPKAGWNLWATDLGKFMYFNGTSWIPSAATPAIATTSSLGVVQPDGITITVSGSGVLTALGTTPVGAATGDLGGTYPNPSVVKVNGSAVPASTGVLASNSSHQLVAATSSQVQTVIGSGVYDVSGAAATAQSNAESSAATLYLPLAGGTLTGPLYGTIGLFTNPTGYGIYADSSDSMGVFGVGDGGAGGVGGSSTSGTGVTGSSSSGTGTVGNTTSGAGVSGQSVSGNGGTFVQTGPLVSSTSSPTIIVKRSNSLGSYTSTGAIIHGEDTTASTGNLLELVKQGNTLFSVTNGGLTTATNFRTLVGAGNNTISASPLAMATSGANSNSGSLSVLGSYYNSTPAYDSWLIYDVVGSGSAPTSTLTFSHSGSSGAATVALPSGSTVSNGTSQQGIVLADGTNLPIATTSSLGGVKPDGTTITITSGGVISSSQGTLQTVTYSATPVFNASLGGAFNLTLTGNVTSSTFTNGLSGPVLVSFRIIQDGTGGRTFVWPSNVRNGGVISPAANARSVQLFMLQTDGSLDAVSTMMYS
jgi:hypothetical protein